MKLQVGIVIVASIPLIAAVIQPAPPVAQPNEGAVRTQSAELSKQEIALRVEETLRTASYLEMRGSVQQYLLRGEDNRVIGGLEPVEFHSWMAPDRLRAEVYKDGALIMAFSLIKGRFQEYRPQSPRRPLIEYDAPKRWGTDDTVLKSDLDCLVASQHQTWAGPHSDRAGYFRQRIEAARQVADQTVVGRRCYVFQEAWSALDEEAGRRVDYEHVTYVDQQTFLVVQWDTTIDGLRRVRLFEPIALNTPIPDECRWSITLDADGPGSEQRERQPEYP